MERLLGRVIGETCQRPALVLVDSLDESVGRWMLTYRKIDW